MSVRNAGSGIAVLHGWRFRETGAGSGPAPPLEEFERLTRDLYVPAGDVGFWQGVIRDPTPRVREARGRHRRAERIVVDVLYGDHEGGRALSAGSRSCRRPTAAGSRRGPPLERRPRRPTVTAPSWLRAAAAGVALLAALGSAGCGDTTGLSAQSSAATASPTTTGQRPPKTHHHRRHRRRASSVALERVVDGDTIVLGTGAYVRLLQIDTPELSSNECYSSTARTALERLLPAGSAVQLQADPALDRTDRYGRLLRYVFRGGRNINIAMVRRGARGPVLLQRRRGPLRRPDLRACGRGEDCAPRPVGCVPGHAASPRRGRGRDPSGTAVRRRRVVWRLRARILAVPCGRQRPGLRRHPRLEEAVRVTGPDPYNLDGNGDGLGCT